MNPILRTGKGITDDKTIRVVLADDSGGGSTGGATEAKQDVAIALLTQIRGFDIPAYDYLTLQYFGTTNNVQYVHYFKNAVEVAYISLEYLGSGVADNDKLTRAGITLAPVV